jgi:multiple sugar transport system permease protein
MSDSPSITLARPSSAHEDATGLAKANRREVLRSVVSQTLLTLVLILFLVPLIWMVATSLKAPAEVFGTPPSLLGDEVRWSNYAEVWTYIPFAQYLLNSFLVAAAGTVLAVGTSLAAAYAFSRLRFRGRDSLFFVFIATLMVPQEVVVIPMFLFMQQLGWTNTYQALIVPWAFTAFGSFMLRQALLTVPTELEDAAKIDGAGHFRILTTIMAPIVRPTIAVLIVFTFINYWNNFLWPLIIVSDTSHTTVPVGLNDFIAQGGNQWHLIMAASTISMLPTALLAILLQRYLIRGIALTGLGGR